MKDGVKDIVAKTVSGVLVAESKGLNHVFIIFTDDTYFEFYGQFTCAGGDRPGGFEKVRSYLRTFPEICIKAEFGKSNDSAS